MAVTGITSCLQLTNTSTTTTKQIALLVPLTTHHTTIDSLESSIRTRTLASLSSSTVLAWPRIQLRLWVLYSLHSRSSRHYSICSTSLAAVRSSSRLCRLSPSEPVRPRQESFWYSDPERKAQDFLVSPKYYWRPCNLRDMIWRTLLLVIIIP